MGRPASQGKLTLYPVLAEQSRFRERIHTLDAAFAAETIRVTEQGEGQVPSIEVRKTSTDYVFIMTGELFVGAKQDRISKHDVLLPRLVASYRLPVYCVEQGRWHGHSSTFFAGKVVSSQVLRKWATKKGSQAVIWNRVASKTGQLNAETPTQTVAATYRSALYQKRSPAFLMKLGDFAVKAPGSVGVVVVIGGRVASFDLFANHQLFVDLWKKLLKSFVLDAIDPHFKGSAFKESRLDAFFGALRQARWNKVRNPGVATEYVIASSRVAGTLLVHGKRVVHLSLFPDKNIRRRNFRTQRPLGTGPPNPNAASSVPREDDRARRLGSGPVNPKADSPK